MFMKKMVLIIVATMLMCCFTGCNSDPGNTVLSIVIEVNDENEPMFTFSYLDAEGVTHQVEDFTNDTDGQTVRIGEEISYVEKGDKATLTITEDVLATVGL